MFLINGAYLVCSEGKDGVRQQGSSNCGGTSVAEWLVAHHSATRISLAFPGRKILRNLTLHSPVTFDDRGDEDSDTKLTLGWALQTTRSKYPTLWVTMALLEMHRQIIESFAIGGTVGLFVIDDVRDPIDSLILRGAGLLGYEVVRDDGGAKCYPSDGMNRGMVDFDSSWVNFNYPFEEPEKLIGEIGRDLWGNIVFHEKHIDRYSSVPEKEPHVLHHIYTGMYHTTTQIAPLSDVEFYAPSNFVFEDFYTGESRQFLTELTAAYKSLSRALEQLATRYITYLVD